MNYFKLHIGDYLRATAHLSLLEHGIYLRLMQVYYAEERAIPADRAARLIGARTPEELAALDAVLKDLFELHDGAWHQHLCEQELSAMVERVAHNREVGKRGGRPKKPKAGDSGSAEKPKENPPGFSREPGTNPSHKPIANSQEKEEGAASAGAHTHARETDPTAGFEPAPGCTPTAVGEIAGTIRRHGIDANPGHPSVRKLAELGTPIETIEAACLEAKGQKGDERITAGLVAAICERWGKQAAGLTHAGHAPVPAPRGSPRRIAPEPDFATIDYGPGGAL